MGGPNVQEARPERARARTRDVRSAGRTGKATGSAGGPAQLGNALEMLRVATTFIVVLYHAALTYATTPLRLTLWVTYDTSGSLAFDTFIYWVNGFAMPAFFLAAGVSAPAACEARGVKTFVTHRARRLLRPLLFGSIVILPITYLVFGYGLLVSGRCTLEDIMRWRFPDTIAPDVHGFLHLWFLEYLFVVCMIYGGGWWLRKRFSWESKPSGETAGPSLAERLLSSSWRPLWFAIPTCLIFLVDSDTMLRVDNRLLPNVVRVLHYTYFFAVGGWIAKVSDPKVKLMPRGTLYLVLSFVLFAVMTPLLLRHNASPLQGWERVVFCMMSALFPWLTIFGSVGVFLRVVEGKGAIMRFLSEASFWVYLIHLPAVGIMQIVLLPYAWPAALKFVIVAVVSIAVSLLSYEYIVRRSLVGEVVNGSRKRTTKRGFFGPEFGWIASVAVLILMASGAVWSSRVFFFDNNFHEESPGKLYRSARLSPKDLDTILREKSIKTVLTFSTNGDSHVWFIDQKKICESRRVPLLSISLKADRLPPRENLLELMSILENAPRPLLIEGYRGISQSGFATAVAELLDGLPPREALRQFDLAYGQFGGPEHTPLGQVVLTYQSWLESHRLTHTADRFREWTRQDYQPGISTESIARSESATVR